ncbi:MAG: hypothetical protein ACR2OM_03650 [Aestuariivirgaceae bacterium]
MIRQKATAQHSEVLPPSKVPLAMMAIQVLREVRETKNDFLIYLFEAAVCELYKELSESEKQRLSGLVEPDTTSRDRLC